MPIYEYECSKCHHSFELIQKITDDPVTQCPKCLTDNAKKLVSAAGFQLKGTGWYETDFKTKAAKDKSSPESTKSTDTTSDPKTESKQSKESKPTNKGDTK